MEEALTRVIVAKIERLEEEIRVLQAKEKEYRELGEQLRQAQKMEAVATLAGGIAHDFNNILQAILSTAQLILMRKSKDDLDYRKLMQIESAANKGSTLVSQLLTLGRKTDHKSHALNLNSRIKEITKLFRRTFPRMIGVELALAGDLKRINVAGDHIDQIIMNLGINARDAMPEGGKIILRTSNVISNDGSPPQSPQHIPDSVLLTVTDTGCGMSPETVEHIFEPFYTTKGPGKGTGLGLSTVKSIVADNGGSIVCSSTPGKGTTFKIYFPVAHTGRRYSKGRRKKETQGALHGSETILLVDDERAILKSGKEMLEGYGYRVKTARKGEEAVTRYARGSIDLVVLDISTPEMGAIECLNKLLAIDTKAKVIITSGNSVDKRVGEALKSGGMAFMAKPYGLKEMLKTVRRVIDA
jgi:signal transduction histidine kinase/CheY-like chemotaxis protein